MVGRTPVTRWLGRLVRARYLRIIPVEFRHTFNLRVEILGCRGGDEFHFLLLRWKIVFQIELLQVVTFFFFFVLQMSWWHPAVLLLPLVVRKLHWNAVNQASSPASRVSNVFPLLWFVMGDWTARIIQMKWIVVRKLMDTPLYTTHKWGIFLEVAERHNRLLSTQAFQVYRTKLVPPADQASMVTWQQVRRASRPPSHGVVFPVWLQLESQDNPEFGKPPPRTLVWMTETNVFVWTWRWACYRAGC